MYVYKSITSIIYMKDIKKIDIICVFTKDAYSTLVRIIRCLAT